MHRKTPKHLEDIRLALESIGQFVSGKGLAEYRADGMLRAAVERNLEIMGEAINRIAKQDPDTADRIGSYAKIIAFRNILAHGYDMIDDEQVWSVVQNQLPVLRQDVGVLLREADSMSD